MPFRRLAAIATLPLLAAQPAYSQEASGLAPADAIIVTHTRLPVPADPAISLLKPVAGEETLPTLLRRVPGLFVEEGGGPGAVASIHLRGTDPNHTSVLIDGIKMNDPTNSRGGSSDIGTLPLIGIDSVSVARGALSAVQGADALGGVVAIETKGGTPQPSGEAALTLGTHDRHQVEAALRGPLGPVRASLSAGDLDSGRLTSGNRLEARQYLLRLDADWEGGTASATLRRHTYDASAFPDDSGGTELAVLRGLEKRDGSATAGGTRLRLRLAEPFSLAVDAAAQRLREDAETPAVAPGPGNPDGLPAMASQNRLDRQTGTATLHYGDDGVRMLAGIGLEREDGRSDGSLDFGFFQLPNRFDLDRTTRSAFAEAGFLPTEGIGGQAGLRLDRAAGHTQTLLSGSLSWRDDDNVLSATYGEGYKLASFYALGNPLVGNPALKPERARSADLTATRRLPFWSGEAVLRLFHTRIRDIVDFEPGPPPRLVNRQGLRVRGGEASLTLQPVEGWTATAFIAHADSRFTDGNPVRDRPRWQAGGGLDWVAGPWRLGAGLRHTGAILDNAVPTGDAHLGAATLLDLTAGWTAMDGIDMDLRAENVLDRHYQQRVGTPGPDRRLSLTLRAGF